MYGKSEEEYEEKIKTIKTRDIEKAREIMKEAVETKKFRACRFEGGVYIFEVEG